MRASSVGRHDAFTASAGHPTWGRRKYQRAHTFTRISGSTALGAPLLSDCNPLASRISGRHRTWTHTQFSAARKLPASAATQAWPCTTLGVYVLSPHQRQNETQRTPYSQAAPLFHPASAGADKLGDAVTLKWQPTFPRQRRANLTIKITTFNLYQPSALSECADCVFTANA